MSAASVRFEGTSAYIRSSYDAEFVYELKCTVPWHLRQWDPSDKVWIVNELWWPEVENLLYEHYDDVRTIGEFSSNEKAAPRATENIPNAYRVLHLLPDAPQELIVAAYRTLAKLNHPDTGGDNDTMRAINLAFEQIQNERWTK